MRYIRTIFNRIISYDENANDIDKPVILKYPSDIIKQSENIPELCDEFIIDLKGHCADAEYDSFRLYEDFKEMYLKWKKDYPDVVGCGSIITRDKNDCIAILPVAKANDEGELELL